MASLSECISPLKEALNQENSEKPTTGNPSLVTELPSISNPMSSTPTEPMGTQEPDGISTNKEIVKSAVDIEIDHQNIEPSMNQLSASDGTEPNSSLEIDAIQKHVTESLLFLNQNNKSNNDPKKIDENVDSNGNLDPSKEITWNKLVPEEQTLNKTEVPEKMDKQTASIREPVVNESVPLGNTQKNTSDVCEKTNANAHLDSSQIAPVHESYKETLISIEKVLKTTDIHEKMDEDVENNVHSEPFIISPVQAINEESLNSVEQTLNTAGVPEKMDENLENNVHLEPSHNASVQEIIKKSVISVEQGQKLTDVPEKMDEDVEINVNLEPSQIDDKIVTEHVDNKGPINKNGDVAPIQECVWERPLSVEQAQTEKQDPEKIGDHIALIHETGESLPLGKGGIGQKETNAVSEKNYEHLDNNVNTELRQITQEHSKESLQLESAQKEKDAVESFRESPTSNKQVEEIDVHEKISSNVPENVTDKTVTLENSQEDSTVSVIVKNVGNIVILESSMKTPTQASAEESLLLVNNQKEINVSAKMDPIMDKTVHFEPLMTASNETALQKSPISSIHENEIENTNESVINVHVEPSQIVHKHQIAETLITAKQEKGMNAFINEDENIVNIEKSQITLKQGNVGECPTLTDKQDETRVERMDEDIDNIHLEPSQIANIQKQYEKTPISTEHIKMKKESEIINENTENGKESTVLSENVKKIKHSEIKEGNIEPSQIAPKQQSVWECPLSSEQNTERIALEKNKSNLVYHTKSAHSGALTAVLIQETQHPPKKHTENITRNEKTARYESLKIVPLQDSSKIAKPQTQNMEKNITYNVKSAHSGFLKEVPIRDLTECPPAKRARIEPNWSTACENTDKASSAAVHESVKETPLSATHTWSLNDASNVSSDVAADSDVSALWESASNRSQSKCSITEDTPMDVDSEDSDEQTSDAVVQYSNDFEEFSAWCEKHDICKVKKELKNDRCLIPFKYSRILKTAKNNRGVLRLYHIPKSFNQGDVHKLIKKYTLDAGKEIAKTIAFIYLYRPSSGEFNTAFIKWKSQDLLNVMKAYELLKRAKLKLDGHQLILAYDDRSKVDWDERERPIIKSHDKLKWERKKPPNMPSTAAAPRPSIILPKIAPFNNGEVDFKDTETYGLSKAFLAGMGISPPLSPEIFVRNLDKELDEDKLRIMFCTAGTIHNIKMYTNATCLNLRVQYDHPLEAIQAITMFDRQMINGRVVKICSARYDPTRATNQYMPKGITQMGPGLGPEGNPIRGVRTTIEVGLLKSKFENEIKKLKEKIEEVKIRLGVALKSQSLQNERMKNEPEKQDVIATQLNPRNATAAVQQYPQNPTSAFQQNPQNITTAFQQGPQDTAAALQEYPQNAMAALTTVIASSVQNNILSMLGLQPNLFEGFTQQNQNSNVVPNSSNLNADTINWTPPPNMQPEMNVQPSPENLQHSLNVQANPQSLPNQSSYGNVQQEYTQPGYSNIQHGPSNIQSGPLNMQPAPSNTQYGPLNVQSGPSMQPTNIQSSTQPAKYQSVASVHSGISNVQPALYQPGILPPPLPGLNTYPRGILYDSNQEKAVSRFDIPPVVAKPQNREPNMPSYNSSNPQLVVPPIPHVTSYQLDIPLPVAKPQNRGLTVKSAFKVQNPTLTTVPVTKAPKSVGIKFNIPSLQTPVVKPTPTLGLDSTSSSVSKPQKREEFSQVAAKQPAYSKLQQPNSSKAKSPEKSWINKQIKAMRRNSKSPERVSKKQQDSRRSRERDYSREREREAEREYKRASTVTFKYLPSSVNSDDLREKMREVGKLVEVRSTGKGQASVSFRHRRDAETCIEMYNRAKVDGQSIEVKWAK